jgi:hypothetical protein
MEHGFDVQSTSPTSDHLETSPSAFFEQLQACAQIMTPHTDVTPDSFPPDASQESNFDPPQPITINLMDEDEEAEETELEPQIQDPELESSSNHVDLTMSDSEVEFLQIVTPTPAARSRKIKQKLKKKEKRGHGALSIRSRSRSRSVIMFTPKAPHKPTASVRRRLDFR